MAMKYDTARWTDAHHKFLDDATTLTDDDLAQLALVDPIFAERARAKRAGFVEADTRTDDEKRLLKAPVTYRELIEFFKDHIFPILSTYRYKSGEAHTRLDALEQRILELEAAQAAARTGQHVER